MRHVYRSHLLTAFGQLSALLKHDSPQTVPEFEAVVDTLEQINDALEHARGILTLMANECLDKVKEDQGAD
jgi:hypothetical protein